MSEDILASIDNAITDYEVSSDAMRWTPERPSVPPRPRLLATPFSQGGIVRGPARSLDRLNPYERIICPDCGSRTPAYNWVAGRSVHDRACPRVRPAGPRTLAERINAARDAFWDAAERGNDCILAGLRWVDGLIPLWFIGLLAAVAGVVLGVVR